MLRSNYGFTFVSEPQTPIYAVTKFINFLRFNGNQKAFLENYDPNTLSVYTKDLTPQIVQSQPNNSLATIADAVADDIKFSVDLYFSIMQGHSLSPTAYNYLRIMSNESLSAQNDVCYSLIEFKKRNISFEYYHIDIKQLIFKAIDYLNLLHAKAQTSLAFAPKADMSDFAHFISKTLSESINDRIEALRNDFREQLNQFFSTRYSKSWLTGRSDDDSFETSFKNESVTLQAIYFLYLSKK
jgi:hypothetical protein